MTYLDRTDKSVNGYLPTYFELASKITTNRANVCELGVDRGGSLEMWQSMFPLGTIVGVDVNPNATWPHRTHKIVIDQTDARLPRLLMGIAPDGYDLVIDDASHEGVRTAGSFELLWPIIIPGRWYVIEDWGVGYRGHAPMYDPTMRTFVHDLVDKIHERSDIASITFRGGLVVVEKR